MTGALRCRSRCPCSSRTTLELILAPEHAAERRTGCRSPTNRAALPPLRCVMSTAVCCRKDGLVVWLVCSCVCYSSCRVAACLSSRHLPPLQRRRVLQRHGANCPILDQRSRRVGVVFQRSLSCDLNNQTEGRLFKCVLRDSGSCATPTAGHPPGFKSYGWQYALAGKFRPSTWPQTTCTRCSYQHCRQHARRMPCASHEGKAARRLAISEANAVLLQFQ